MQELRQEQVSGSVPVPHGQLAQGSFRVVDHDSEARSTLEARIRSGFGAHFDACLAGFMPRFAHYQHAGGGTGVIGVRRASNEPLFLENYLGDPIERVVSDACGYAVCRSEIAEVGQFVVDDRDIVGDFFNDLVPFLVGHGFAWVCFTGTSRIRAILESAGLRGLSVATADVQSVAELPDSWGTYYEHDPVVVVGSLADPRGRWCERPTAWHKPLAVGA